MKIDFADIFADQTLDQQQAPRIRQPGGTSRPGTARPGSNTQGVPKCDVKGGGSTTRPRAGNRESLHSSRRSRRKQCFTENFIIICLIRSFDTKISKLSLFNSSQRSGKK